MRRMIPTLFTAAALLLAPDAATAAAQVNDDNTAVAVNTHDGRSVFRLAFSIRQITDDTVDSGNAAVAYASCEECRTVAIAIQVVLAVGDAETVTPTNLALAINQTCTSCETMALAYQYVFSGGDPVMLSGDGRRRLAELRVRLQRLRDNEAMTLESLAAEVEAITDEVAVVLRDELVTRPGAPDETTTTTGGDTTSSTTSGEGTSGGSSTTSTSTSSTSTTAEQTTTTEATTTSTAP